MATKSKKIVVTNDLPENLMVEGITTIQLANEGQLVLGRKALYGLILKDGKPIEFEHEGTTYRRGLTVFLPGEFPGMEEFHKEMEVLNHEVKDLKKGVTKMAELRRGQVVRLTLVWGKLFISDKVHGPCSIQVPTVRTCEVLGWQAYPEEPKNEVQETKAPTERKAPRSLRRIGKSTTA